MIRYDNFLTKPARRLRRSMTEAELLLWSRLRRKQICAVSFNRQKPLGRYIADFYCHSAKLVIELDGGQHYLEEGLEADRQRDAFMKKHGLMVLRFSNEDVLNNIQGVMETIARKTEARLL